MRSKLTQKNQKRPKTSENKLQLLSSEKAIFDKNNYLNQNVPKRPKISKEDPKWDPNLDRATQNESKQPKMRPKLIPEDPKWDKTIQTEAITDITTQNQPKQAKTSKT